MYMCVLFASISL